MMLGWASILILILIHFKLCAMIKKIILNCSKRKVITFIRLNPFFTDYTLSGYELDRITHVDDLGVYMDLKLKFSDYYFIITIYL